MTDGRCAEREVRLYSAAVRVFDQLATNLGVAVLSYGSTVLKLIPGLLPQSLITHSQMANAR